MKTLKPMIKDAEPNKYVLEAVKSRDPIATFPFGKYTTQWMMNE